jgi:undecaprenyl-diphosphatase
LGVLVANRPWPNFVDRLGFDVFPVNEKASWAETLTHLGSTPALVSGIVCLAGLALLRRDRLRAISCVVGPLAAVVAAQWMAKPLVARPFEDTGILTYPSGTATVVAALATGLFLVVPVRAKPWAALLGAVTATGVSIAIVVLRWHYPTDVLGGLALGMGTVLLVDGALRKWRRAAGRHRTR